MSVNAEALQAQNNELQDAINNLSAEKAGLFRAAETENGSLRNQVTNLQTANKILRNENDKLLDDAKVLSTTSSNKIEALKTRNDEMQESADMSTEAGNTTLRELDDVKAKYSEVQRQMSLADNVNDDARRYAGSLELPVSGVTTDLEDARATLRLRDQELVDIKQQHKLAQEDLAAEKRTNQTLKNKITELEHAPSRNRKMLEAQIAQEQARVAKLEEELDDMISDIKAKDSEIEEMGRDLREKATIAIDATRPTDAQDDIDDLFTGTDEIGKLEAELAQVKQEHTWEMRRVRNDMDELKRGLEEKEGEIETWRARRSLMDRREVDAKATIASLEERIGQLEMRLI